MYDVNAAGAAGSATLAVTGMAYSSWMLIGVALIALGGTLWSLSVRWKNRNGAKP